MRASTSSNTRPYAARSHHNGVAVLYAECGFLSGVMWM